tara:strand:- start:241 stop:735 length:495 start_codon:yes stop_codon:yes gene_type:complete
MARYKKYKYGGKKVPGMYAQDGIETKPAMNAPITKRFESPVMNTGYGPGSREIVSAQQREFVRMQQLQQMQQQRMQEEMMMQMKLQNDSLKHQNQLLQTQISKADLINSARTTKQTPGATTSPKKRGGSNARPKISRFISGNAGNVMKHGGSCLPGGRGSKKRM